MDEEEKEYEPVDRKYFDVSISTDLICNQDDVIKMYNEP